MIFVKTDFGQQSLRVRHGTLSPRQRSAFILFDGKRTLQQVLDATAAMGITEADVQLMVDAGLLAHANPLLHTTSPRAAVAPQVAPAPKGSGSGGSRGSGSGSNRTPGERYQEAYVVAAELTAGLGLRGFRLHLAVERATGYEPLAELAPKIREAVGEAQYQPLERALFA